MEKTISASRLQFSNVMTITEEKWGTALFGDDDGRGDYCAPRSRA